MVLSKDVRKQLTDRLFENEALFLNDLAIKESCSARIELPLPSDILGAGNQQRFFELPVTLSGPSEGPREDVKANVKLTTSQDGLQRISI